MKGRSRPVERLPDRRKAGSDSSKGRYRSSRMTLNRPFDGVSGQAHDADQVVRSSARMTGVAISRSGTSGTAGCRAADRRATARHPGHRFARRAGYAAGRAGYGHRRPSFADEQSLVQTRFPTTQLARPGAQRWPSRSRRVRHTTAVHWTGWTSLSLWVRRPGKSVAGQRYSATRRPATGWARHVARRPRSRCASRRAPGGVLCGR